MMENVVNLGQTPTASPHTIPGSTNRDMQSGKSLLHSNSRSAEKLHTPTGDGNKDSKTTPVSSAAQVIEKHNPRSKKKIKQFKEDHIIHAWAALDMQKEQRMVKYIREIMESGTQRIYKNFRREFDERLQDLDREKTKLLRKKKNKKDKHRYLKMIAIEKVWILSSCVKQTFMHYRKNYFEDDYARQNRLLEIQHEDLEERQNKERNKIASKPPKKRGTRDQRLEKQSHVTMQLSKQNQEQIYKGKKYIQQFEKFYDSSFADDKRFVVHYFAQLTRDKIHYCKDLVDRLFYERIFDLINTSSKKEFGNKLKAFDIICNLVTSDVHRSRLVDEAFFDQVFNNIEEIATQVKNPTSMKILEKLSLLIVEMCFQPDIHNQIIRLRLLSIILTLSDKKYPNSIRSNSVFAISLLTYNEELFGEIVGKGVIDIIMDLIRDKDQYITVTQFSTLALVHFALNEQSIGILIHKGVLELFDSFTGTMEGEADPIIQTNVSWIFLALCHNGISGAVMLKNGITRDMFLVSCNPDFEQIRHLVITGFAQLGRSRVDQFSKPHISIQMQWVKEAAVVAYNKYVNVEASTIVTILLHMAASENSKFQSTAFWALKDYVLLVKCSEMLEDISQLIMAFVTGTLETSSFDCNTNHKIQNQCAHAISFLVTHRLVYKSNISQTMSQEDIQSALSEIKDVSKPEFILDAVIYLSGVHETSIRTTAFSMLSSLSKYSSTCESVKAQIMRDIKLPEGSNTKDYYQFVKGRLFEQKTEFYQQYRNFEIEQQYQGLYSLLRLRQEPSDEEVDDVSDRYIQFIEGNIDYSNEDYERNEKYFIGVFNILKLIEDPKILRKLLKVIKFYINADESKYQKDIINPNTIIWMLEILHNQREEKYLCAVTASVLLTIVDKHQIHFDYQEVAIIKKFNKALQFIEGINQTEEAISSNNHKERYKRADDSTSEEEQVLEIDTKTFTPAASPAKIEESDSVNTNTNMESEEHGSSKSRSQKPEDQELEKNVDDTDVIKVTVYQKSTGNSPEPARGSMSDERNDTEGALILEERNDIVSDILPASKMFILEDSKEQSQGVVSKSLTTSQKDTPIVVSDPDSQQSSGPISPKSSSFGKKALMKPGSNRSANFAVKGWLKKSSELRLDKLPLKTHSRKGSEDKSVDKDSPSYIDWKREHTLKIQNLMKSQLSGATSLKSKSSMVVASLIDGGVKKRSSGQQSVGQYGMINQTEEKLREDELEWKLRMECKAGLLNIDDIDPHNTELIDIHFRDSLIKAFMVIFNNPQSQHLLLNKDLIDIAFNCLELCNECSLEAKRQVARLISIIFKFPQVQQKFMDTDVVTGICDLMNQSTEIDIVRFTLKAVTYISMNYEFIMDSTYSGPVLSTLITLLDQMQASQDQYNIIKSIKNILKGSKQNKRLFIDGNCFSKFVQIILHHNDTALIEMCVHGIAELASYKKFMVGILQNSVETSSLNQIIKKAVDITEGIKDGSIHISNTFTSFREDALLDQQNNILKKSINAPHFGDRHAISMEVIANLDKSSGQNRNKLLETKPTFRAEESDIEIPEFMKNDLREVDIDDSQNISRYEKENQIPVQTKIRNNTYFIIARSFRFGLNTQYVLKQCNLVQNLIKDLSQLETPKGNQHFMFFNIMHAIAELKSETRAIQELLGNNYELIFDQIMKTPDTERRKVIMKTCCTLILEASDELATNYMLFDKVFQIANDQKSDESMIEIVLWFTTSLCDQRFYNVNYNKILNHMVRNQVILIIWKSLCSKEERIILQSLKLLAKLCVEDEFKKRLINQQEIFAQLKTISSQTPKFDLYKVQIETAICDCLDKISKINLSSQSSSVNQEQFGGLMINNASINIKQLDQVKIFNKYLINLALSKVYVIKRLDDSQDDNDDIYDTYKEMDNFNPVSMGDIQNASNIAALADMELMMNIVEKEYHVSSHEQSRLQEEQQLEKEIQQVMKGTEQTQPNQIMITDDIETFDDSNSMIENVIQSLMNISTDFALHKEMISNGIIDVIKKFVDQFLQCAKKQNANGEDETKVGIDLEVIPVEPSQMLKSLIAIMLNFSTNPIVHTQCVNEGMISILVNCAAFHEYEVYTYLFKTMGNFATCKNTEVRKKTVSCGCIQEMLNQNDNSEYFKIKRICSEYLNIIADIDPQMFQLNDRLQKTKQREREMISTQSSPAAM